MASIKSSSFLDSESMPIISIGSKEMIENKSLGINFNIELGYTASSFNTMSIANNVTLTVDGNLEVINI